MRRGLADARQRLGYGTGDSGPFNRSTIFGDAPVHLLHEAVRLAEAAPANATATSSAGKPQYSPAELNAIRESFETMVLA